MDIQDCIVINGEPKNDAYQGELAVVLERSQIEPELVRFVTVREHTWKKADQMFEEINIWQTSANSIKLRYKMLLLYITFYDAHLKDTLNTKAGLWVMFNDHTEDFTVHDSLEITR